MSTLAVTTVTSANNTTDLTLRSANTNAGAIIVSANGTGITIQSNSTTNAMIINSTAWYIGGVQLNNTVVRQSFTGNGSTTTFTVTGGYTPNNLDVYQNGIKISSPDVTISSGTNVVFAVAPPNGALIEVVGQIAGTINYSTVNTQASYTWTNTHTFSNDVTINANLTITGTTVTVNTQTLDVKDANITVAKGAGGGSAANGAGIQVDSTAANFYWSSGSNAWTSNVNLNVINGSLGVGTASPAAQIEAVVTAAGSLPIRATKPINAVGTAPTIRAYGYSPSYELLNKDSTQNWYFGINDDDGKKLYIGRGYGPNQGVPAANSASIVIDTGDNVGIGTNAPAYRLSLNNSTGSGTGITFSCNSLPVAIGRGALINYWTDGSIFYNDFYNYESTGIIRFGTVGNERMRIGASGDVNIGGVTDAGNTLRYFDVYNTNTGSSAGAIVRLITSNTAGTGSTTVDIVKYKNGLFSINNNDPSGIFAFNNAGAERMRLDASSGALLVGRTSLYSASGISAGLIQSSAVSATNGSNIVTLAPDRLNFNASIYYVLNQSSVGVNLVNGATAWASQSDLRLKDVTGTYINAISDLLKLEAIKFTWKSDETKKPNVGLSAQSVQKAVPEAVYEDDQGYLNVKYTEVIPLLTAAIQELKAENDALRARVEALETK